MFVTCLSFKEKRYCPFFILKGCAEQSWHKKKTCASHLPCFMTKPRHIQHWLGDEPTWKELVVLAGFILFVDLSGM